MGWKPSSRRTASVFLLPVSTNYCNAAQTTSKNDVYSRTEGLVGVEDSWRTEQLSQGTRTELENLDGLHKAACS